MFTHKLTRVLMAVMASTTLPVVAADDTPNLGTPVSQEEISGWDITVFPSGKGLPAGSGTAAQGGEIYAAKCVACHGDKGQGGLGPTLISDRKRQGIDEAGETIANYWPFSTSVFDYIRRAMPWQSPKTLTNEEVYALTAFILEENKLIPPGTVVNANSLPKVKMPNRDGFILRFPKLTPPIAINK